MHLAILMTNTDESAFAQRHPKDGEKFTSMIKGVRPNWTVEVFSVKDGEFPDNLGSFDGALITGSPASVNDDAVWVRQLIIVIKGAIEKSLPLFGACFGHQAIAMAMGVPIVENPGGWVIGRTSVEVANRPAWARDLPSEIDQYAAHIEQVAHLPDGAVNLLTSPECEIGGFAIGKTVATTQNHPEMTPEFAAALVDEYAPKLPEQAANAAKHSLTSPVDGQAYAEAIARFFEQAQ